MAKGNSPPASRVPPDARRSALREWCGWQASLLALLAASMLVLLVARSPRKEQLRGEIGQEVLGCMCVGRKRTHGYCGYHFYWGSQEDKPWCRTVHSCGVPSIIEGSWTYCDERGVERRRADDGRLYNAKEFKDFYADKGKEKWAAAEAHIERRIANNGKSYTVFEFRDYYIDALGEQGWVTEWAAALPEQRQAHDGKWYSWEEFAKQYGDAKARSVWAAAKPRGESDL